MQSPCFPCISSRRSTLSWMDKIFAHHSRPSEEGLRSCSVLRERSGEPLLCHVDVPDDRGNGGIGVAGADRLIDRSAFRKGYRAIHLLITMMESSQLERSLQSL